MSHAAIAAVLALDDLTVGERLAAFSLASFANREQRAWPGTRLAAARAGLSRSQYLASRSGLVQRGLVVVETHGGGRGQAPSVLLGFGNSGPWFGADVNAELLESVLSHSRARGSARALLATLAAVADEDCSVSAFSTGEIRSAAGTADSTYRRARAVLLSSDELLLRSAGGGRGNANHWVVQDPRLVNPAPVMAAQSQPRTPNARPLIAMTRRPSSTAAQTDPPGLAFHTGKPRGKGSGLSGVCERNPGHSRTVYDGKGPGMSGVSGPNPGQSRTVSSKTPPQTPPETPPPSARTGREPKNPGTLPPSPPGGGSGDGSVTIVEDYVTERGRRRQRTVVVELDQVREQLRHPVEVDLGDWARVRCELRCAVGESMFEIWLAPLHLVGADRDGCLLLASPPSTRSWLAGRYGQLLENAGRSSERVVRLATDRELQLLDRLTAAQRPPLPTRRSNDHQEAV